MAEKVLTAFRLDPDLIARMKAVTERDGVPAAEQVRRALSEWLDKREGEGRATTTRRKARR